MGSNIYFFPLNDQTKQYIQALKPDIIFPQEKPKDLTYKDLEVIFNRFKKWGWRVDGYSPNEIEFDVFISREISGDEGRNLYITLWVKEENGNPHLMFYKGRHSIGLLIVKEITILCGAQFVCNDSDFSDCYVITNKTDIALLMKNWLKEDLYEDHWQQRIE